MTLELNIGDRVRAYDRRDRTDSYVEVVINGILPGVQQYLGHVLKEVIAGKEADCRLGFNIRIPAEGTMRRDWDGRLERIPALLVPQGE